MTGINQHIKMERQGTDRQEVKGKPPTAKQIAFAKRVGMKIPDDVSSTDVTRIIGSGLKARDLRNAKRYFPVGKVFQHPLYGECRVEKHHAHSNQVRIYSEMGRCFSVTINSLKYRFPEFDWKSWSK